MSIHYGGRGPGHRARVQGGRTDWIFTSGGLDPRITFTRASSGTYFDSAGVMQTATTDVPRFNYEYNGSSWVAKGLLIEPAATNLLLRSREFDNASWVKNRTSVTANAIASPDGTTTADKIVEDTSVSATPRAYQLAAKAASSLTRTFSVYLKAGERTKAALRFTDQVEAVAARVDVDLSAGTIGSTSITGGATITASSATIRNAGGGWYRCTITATFDATITSTAAFINLRDAAGAITYTGDGASGLYAWGAQVEDGSAATSFIETTSATATRAADVASITGSNFSSWFNPTEFTAVLEVSPLAACPVGVNQRLLSFSDGTTSNRILLYRTDVGTFLQVKSGGSLGVQTTGAILSPGSTSKIVISCKENNFRMSINGGSVLTDSLGAMPTGIDRMGIGYDVTAAAEGALAHFARLTFYPVGSYSDAALQGLST